MNLRHRHGLPLTRPAVSFWGEGGGGGDVDRTGKSGGNRAY